MKFDKTQKRALVFVAGLLGLSWYMGNQFEKADMMRSEGKLPCCPNPSLFQSMRGVMCRECGKEDRITLPRKDDLLFDKMRSEGDAYTYAYNEGHSDSRKDEGYQPTLASAREEGRFRKILKQRAEALARDWKWKGIGWTPEEEATLSREEKEAVAEQLYNDWRAGKIEATDVDEYYERLENGAETFNANQRKYQAVDVPLGMVCVLCEQDKPATHRIVENGMPFFLCEKHWFNYKMGASNIHADLGAESSDMIYVPMSLGSYSCEPVILGIFREERDAISAIHDSIKEENTEFYHEEDSLIWTDEDDNRWELHIYSERILSGLESYEAETFNAPYAGSGSLMSIGQDTSLGNFTSKELTESSAIHGDFNEASLNYSGHQNLQVRGAESEETQITDIDWETDGEDVELPSSVMVPSDLEEDEIADYLSDNYGWLVNGFVMGAETFNAPRYNKGGTMTYGSLDFERAKSLGINEHGGPFYYIDSNVVAIDNYTKNSVRVKPILDMHNFRVLIDLKTQSDANNLMGAKAAVKEMLRYCLGLTKHRGLLNESFSAETMTPSEVKVKVTKDVTPKGSKIIVEECVDIQAHKADTTANFYRVRFRDPAEMSNFRVPAWAARAANTMGSKYYDVAGSKVTMGQDKSGNWKIQSIMVPKRANVDVDLALKIANHIQDRLEKEGRWASKKCQDNERVLIIR